MYTTLKIDSSASFVGVRLFRSVGLAESFLAVSFLHPQGDETQCPNIHRKPFPKYHFIHPSKYRAHQLLQSTVCHQFPNTTDETHSPMHSPNMWVEVSPTLRIFPNDVQSYSV